MTSTERDSSLTIQDLKSLRGTLIRVREENVADLAAARSTIDTLLADGSAGDPSLREDVANAEYMTEDATSIIAMVDAALVRMEKGTYGICTKCHRAIPLARLQLRPHLPNCVACSS
jgi:RNA polymerase-binding transcription factor DksA